MQRFTRSRTFAVLIREQGLYGAYMLYRKTPVGEGDGKPELIDTVKRGFWPADKVDDLIDILKLGGLTVRYFDYTEKLWMDHSIQYGLVPAPGARDGSWSFPSLESFERDYIDRI